MERVVGVWAVDRARTLEASGLLDSSEPPVPEPDAPRDKGDGVSEWSVSVFADGNFEFVFVGGEPAAGGAVREVSLRYGGQWAREGARYAFLEAPGGPIRRSFSAWLEGEWLVSAPETATVWGVALPDGGQLTYFVRRSMDGAAPD